MTCRRGHRIIVRRIGRQLALRTAAHAHAG
jgi:hypothetical protein